jgi:hypothetical protein
MVRILFPPAQSLRTNRFLSSRQAITCAGTYQSRITLGPASRNTSIINSEPGLVRTADAREAEMLASAFAESHSAP